MLNIKGHGFVVQTLLSCLHQICGFLPGIKHTHTHTHTHNYILYKWVLLICQIKTNDISHSDEFNDSSPVLC